MVMFNIIPVPTTLHLETSFALHFWPLTFFVWDESIDWRHHRSTGVSSEARPELGVSEMERPAQSRNNIYALERDLYHGQFCYDNEYQFNFEVVWTWRRGRSDDCLWCRSARRTTVTMVLLSWEKWPRTLFQSSLGSLSLRRISVRWDKVWCDGM